MKRTFIFTICFLPSLAFADRLGGLKSNAQVLLSTQSSTPCGNSGDVQMNSNGSCAGIGGGVTGSASGGISDISVNNGVVTAVTGGGGGSLLLGIGTGTYTNFTNNVSTPAKAVSFEGMQFKVVNLTGTTAYVVIDTMSSTGVMNISSMSLYMTQSSSTANDLKLSSASFTYFQKAGIYVASGTAGASMLISGSNNVSAAAPIFNVNSASVAVLSSGKVLNSQIDNTSVTVQGVITAGTGISVTNGANIVTIANTGPLLTSTQSWSGVNTNLSTTVFTGQVVYTPSATPTSGIQNGQTWIDSTLNKTGFNLGNLIMSDGGMIFISTGRFTLANSVQFSTINLLNVASIGTTTIPANFLKLGHMIHIHADGWYSTSSNPTLNLTYKWNGVVLNTSGARTMGTTLSSSPIHVDINTTVYSTGSSGTVWSQADWQTETAGLPTTITEEMPASGATATVNTTGTTDIIVSFAFGTANAANNMSITNFYVEIK